MRCIKVGFVLFVFLFLTSPPVLAGKAINNPRPPITRYKLIKIAPLSNNEIERSLEQVYWKILGKCAVKPMLFVEQVYKVLDAPKQKLLLASFQHGEQLKEARNVLWRLNRIGLSEITRADLDQISMVNQASALVGVDPAVMLVIGWNESLWGRKTTQNLSSATGSFQIIDATWFGLIRDHGSRYGFGNWSSLIGKTGQGELVLNRINFHQRQEILNLRDDPWLATVMAAQHLKDESQNLQAFFKVKPTVGKIYLSWVLGAPALQNFLLLGVSDPELTSDAALGDEIVSNNPSVFTDNGDPLEVRKVVAIQEREQTALYLLFKRLLAIDQTLLQGMITQKK